MRKLSLASTDSTNNYLMAMADAGEFLDEDVVVAISDYQTAGRGMGSNKWESESGKNLLFSILIRPSSIPPRWQYLLSMTEALALRDGIAKAVGEGCADKVKIKWPNDIYYEDCKISGTLIDLSLTSSGIRHMVIGTGVNVNQECFLSDAPNPVSLIQMIGKEYSREQLLDDILGSFQRYYHSLIHDDAQQEIVRLYHEYLYRRRGFHLYEDDRGCFLAEIVCVAPDGILTLRREDATEQQYEFKQVKAIITPTPLNH